MGCDIHSFLEYKKKNSTYWESMTNNFGSRDYIWFGVIAGVRCPEYQLFEPKGIPEGDLSYYTNLSYWFHVAPDDRPDYADLDHWTTRERATRWVKDGTSTGVYKEDGITLDKVSDPDSHTHSWLTTSELEEAINYYKNLIRNNNDLLIYRDPIPTPWLAILSAMKAFELSEYDTRIVFWFDN